VATQSRIEKLINLNKIIEDLSTDKVLKVGWLEKNRYPAEQGGKYIAEVAAQNEYGAPHKHIPARPFLGPAVANNKTTWLKLAEQGAKKAIKGETNILGVLDLIGAKAAGDVAKAIKDVTSPPLSPVTIQARLDRLKSKSAKRRGVTASLEKPLIDTGIMLRSITHAIESE
jgi:hypothetical protein